ncbi:carboxypeptidase B1-like [Babylonia areolata]|uniref:carboxypeptidase B1-like n=1 Tax=Babylonia areolata TaxID=304850 RepID=UPI003FD22A69
MEKLFVHFLAVVSATLSMSITSLPAIDERAASSSSSSSSSPSGQYGGYQVLQIQFHNQRDATIHLQELTTKYPLDVWRGPINGTVDVMVAPQLIDDVIGFAMGRGASYDVRVADVQRLLESSMDHLDPGHRQRRSAHISPHIVAQRYLRFRQIRQFLRYTRFNATHADVIVSNLGRTFKRRATPYVTVRQKQSRDVNKRVVVIEAGMHAREWIAPAMALNIIYKLAFNPDNDPDIEQLLEKFDWVIIPVTNPDGYIFSQKNITTRLWRKTRTTLYAFGHVHCYGVDGNRNFGFEWTDTADKGGSSNPCDDNFSGPQGFSEPETRNVRSLLLRLRTRIALFLSLHSFGQFFLYPWGYDSRAVLEDEADLREIANQFADVMLQRNRWYQTGSSSQVLYAAAGASDDFARGGAGVKYAFTIELSPSDASHYGFLLPPRQIATVVEDHWPAFKAIALTIWHRLNEADPHHHHHHHHHHTPTSTSTSTTNPNNNGRRHSVTSSTSTAAATAGRTHGGDGLTEVTIEGHTFRLNLNDPAVAQWMEYYINLLNYRNGRPMG